MERRLTAWEKLVAQRRTAVYDWIKSAGRIRKFPPKDLFLNSQAFTGERAERELGLLLQKHSPQTVFHIFTELYPDWLKSIDLKYYVYSSLALDSLEQMILESYRNEKVLPTVRRLARDFWGDLSSFPPPLGASLPQGIKIE